MKYMKVLTILTILGLAAMSASAQTAVPVIAQNNGTIDTGGPKGNPWYHNAQGPGDYAQYSISTFLVTPDLFDGPVNSISELSISYTQANASFTTDGTIQFFITFDPAIGTNDYAGLIYSGSGIGIDDTQFSDSPSTQSLGSFTFTQVESGTVDTYVLDFSTQQDAILAAIAEERPFSIILAAPDGGTAATYAGNQSNSYPDSITINVTASNGGSGGEDSALMITGVMDGPLPGGLPKGIELVALADIPDLSIYGIGSANNGDGTDGEELTLSGSATAGQFIYIASDETEFTNVWGMAPDFIDGAANINGDDALELFMNGNVVDVFGEIDVDGNGTAWEYMDSWAYRTAAPPPDGTFVLDNWSFGGVDALDGLDAAGVAAAIPFGTFTVVDNSGPFDTIKIDFGNPTTETGWNSVTDDAKDGTPVALVNLDGNPTSVSIASTVPWNGINSSGSTTGTGDFIADATSDSIFGNDVVFGGAVAPNPVFEISGLNPEEFYTLTIFASRLSTSDNRTTEYTATGENVVVGELNPANNETETVSLYNVVPTDAGTIAFDFKKAASNNNGSGFIYMGATIITEGWMEVLDPVDPSLMITGVMDGTLPGGLPKAVELYVFNDIDDLSRYGLGAANNGDGTDGVELVLEGSATAGQYLYVASDETEFTNVWGFAPDFVGGAANINGDDAVELFLDDEVIDVFGLIDVDGSGEPWEYTNSWAYRTTPGEINHGTFNIDDWTFAGVDALNDLDAAGIAEAVPFGFYPNPIPVPDPLPWEEAVSGDFIISPWFGAFEVSTDGWLNHSELLWIHVGYVEDTDSMWMYSLWLNTWIWSSMDTWPWVYNTTTGTWFYYFNIPNVGIWQYDAGTGQWAFFPAG